MNSPQAIDPALAKTFLVKFTSPKHLKEWIHNFLDFDFPDSWVDPDSNSSPIHWMFDTYKLYEANMGHTSPSTIIISSRESYKTLSQSVFAIIMMVQFGASIAHMAAIVPQATAAQTYIEMWIQRIQPYLAYHNIELDSKNAKEVSLKLANGKVAYMKIIVCSVSGANSSHTSIFTIDEIDTIRSKEQIRAYKEAQFIPGVFDGQHPLTVKTSTLKFPGGLFTKEMEKAQKSGWRVYRWNIIDITEKCKPDRHLPDEPKQLVYVNKKLPLKTISPAEYEVLIDKEREEYDQIEAMAGCAKCPLLPVCRGRLAARKETDTGGLWKPIEFTISEFAKTDADLAEAQLMCWKPSSAGMVYPRFLDKADGTGNTLTPEQAWESFTGTPAPKRVHVPNLIDQMLKKGVRFYCGVDWGSTHAFAITVSALMANKEWWLVDAYSVSGLEFEQMMSLAMTVRDTYKPARWFADDSAPMFIKAFKKNGMPCAKFTKDVMGGIESVRGQILNGKGARKLKVIKYDRTDIILKVFAEHCFMLDSLGNLTNEPDDSDIADVADTLRYQGQNLFKPRGVVASPSFMQGLDAGVFKKVPTVEHAFQDWQTQKHRNQIGEKPIESSGRTFDKNVVWDFGGDDGKEEDET